MAPYYDQGDYNATIVRHYYTQGQYGLQLAIEIEPEGGDRKRTVYLGLLDENGNTAQYADRTVEALHAIGYHDQPSRLDPQSANPASLVGQEIEVTCKYNKNNNESWYVRTPRPENVPVEPKTLRQIDALFGKAVNDGKKASQPQPETKPPSPSADAVNRELDTAAEAEAPDGIPF